MTKQTYKIMLRFDVGSNREDPKLIMWKELH